MISISRYKKKTTRQHTTRRLCTISIGQYKRQTTKQHTTIRLRHLNALANACKRTQDEIQQGEDHTIPRRRENNDHMRGGGELLERHKRSPVGSLKERNIKLRSLEHDTFLPHAKNIFYTFQVFYPNQYQRKERCIQPTEKRAPPPRPRHPMPP